MQASSFNLFQSIKLYGGFYSALFGCFVLLGPFLPLFLQSKGFSTIDIGFIIGAATLTKIVAPSFWGIISDRTGKRVQLIQISLCLSYLSLIPLNWDLELYQMVAVLLVFNFFMDAALPVFEANTLLNLGINAKYYGIIRGVGTSGYILSLVLLPSLIHYFGISVMPLIMLALLTVLLVITRYLPNATVPVEEFKPQSRLKHFLKQRPTWMFLIVAVLYHASFAPISAFFTLYCTELGFSTTIIGLFWAIGPAVEILVFFRLSQFIHQFGYFGLAAIGFSTMTFRLIATPFVGDSTWAMMLLMTTHALCYAPVHGAMIYWAKDHFGDSYSGTALGLYSGLAAGIGVPISAAVAGYLWKAINPQAIFYFGASLSMIALVLIGVEVLCQRLQRRAKQKSATQI